MNGPTAQKGKKSLTLSQILSALPNLKPKELTTIKAVIEQLQPKNPPGYEIQLLFSVILVKADIHMTWAQFESSTAHKDFQTHAPGAVLFITKTFGGTQTRILAVMKLLIGLLIDDLKKREIPVTLGTMCRNLHLLPMVFDDNFPHYRESGLVPMLMKQMEK